MKTRIVFPELENPIIKSAIEKAREKFPDFELVGADSLEHACLAVKNQLADSLIAGIDYSSRDVIFGLPWSHRGEKSTKSLKADFFR